MSNARHPNWYTVFLAVFITAVVTTAFWWIVLAAAVYASSFEW